MIEIPPWESGEDHIVDRLDALRMQLRLRRAMAALTAPDRDGISISRHRRPRLSRRRRQVGVAFAAMVTAAARVNANQHWYEIVIDDDLIGIAATAQDPERRHTRTRPCQKCVRARIGFRTPDVMQ